MKKILLLVFSFVAISVSAQTYELQNVDGKNILSSFAEYPSINDKAIFASVLTWITNEVCTKGQDAIEMLDYEALSFKTGITIKSPDNEKVNYKTDLYIRVTDGRLSYTLSNIMVESAAMLGKNLTPIEKLQPEKKSAHKTLVNNFVLTSRKVVYRILDYVTEYGNHSFKHWDEIVQGKVVKGMTEDEVLLTSGKPQSKVGGSKDSEWKYNLNYSVFFKDGIVKTVLH